MSYFDNPEPNEAAAMFSCPYYQGYGSCGYSCHEEPACHVDMPDGGWEAFLPKDFDMDKEKARHKAEQERADYKRWLDAEQRWLTRPTLEPMTETGIYPANPASPLYAKGTRFIAHERSDGGSATSYCTTYEEGEQWLAKQQAFHNGFWDEKVTWRENGSMTTDRIKSEQRPALVVGATHFVPAYLGLRPNDRGAKGMGGRVVRWRMIEDGPDGKVYETDSMYYQGKVPDSHRDRLPDNAVWVDSKGTPL